MKWKVFYSNLAESIYKSFTIKASNKHEAIEKSIQKIKKLYGFNDRMLNHYSIEIVLN